MDRRNRKTNVYTNNTRSSVSVYRDSIFSRFTKSYNHPESDRGYKRNRHYKYLPAVIALLFSSPVNAETVGGVSATASPIANVSEISVTSRRFRFYKAHTLLTLTGEESSVGPTRNFTPYVTGTASAQKPYEPYFNDPVYDVSDNFGAFDDEGNDIGDGLIDNPGDIQFYKRTRTGQKDNYSLGIGFSMTWSTPTDKKLQELCKEAAASNIALMNQAHANKRLDFEIARLKNCGELMQRGIMFRPGTEMAKICADVVVVGKNTITPHRHTIPAPSARELPYSESAADLGAPLKTRP